MRRVAQFVLFLSLVLYGVHLLSYGSAVLVGITAEYRNYFKQLPDAEVIRVLLGIMFIQSASAIYTTVKFSKMLIVSTILLNIVLQGAPLSVLPTELAFEVKLNMVRCVSMIGAALLL